MLPVRDILSEKLILADGAMGTYFASRYQLPIAFCETANLEQPEKIRAIHETYRQAGSMLLRANTFSVIQSLVEQPDIDYVSMVRQGFSLAARSAGTTAWAAADFGPVYGLDPDRLKQVRQQCVEALAQEGAELFVLETFADPDDLDQLARIIRQEVPQAVILASFAITADGYTRMGLPLDSLSAWVDQNDRIDFFGLNCGVGPTHLRKLVRQLPQTGKPLSLMPNSGYPRMENQRMVFTSTPDYFADSLAEIEHPRLRILGGCCGTSPNHIQCLAKRIATRIPSISKSAAHGTMPAEPVLLESNNPSGGTTETWSSSLIRQFNQKLQNKQFVMVCELDPPRQSDLTVLIKAAGELRDAGIDAVTFADSPLARVKMDPVVAAARILRETKIPVIPHLTCRDRNVNALRSLLLGAHSEGIRHVLAVTGDRIPEDDKGYIKPVFNVNSNGLMTLIRQMNQEWAETDRIMTAAALDTGVVNPQAEIKRAAKKFQDGAVLFLTQPIYQWNKQTCDLIQQVRAIGGCVLLGLMPLVSLRNATYMDQEVPGITVPTSLINQFQPDMDKEQAEQIGLHQILDVAAAARSYVDGFYLIAPFNRTSLIRQFMDENKNHPVITG